MFALYFVELGVFMLPSDDKAALCLAAEEFAVNNGHGWMLYDLSSSNDRRWLDSLLDMWEYRVHVCSGLDHALLKASDAAAKFAASH